MEEVATAASTLQPVPTTITTAAAAINIRSQSPKSPEPESETPTRIQPATPLSFTNGFLKRHHLRPIPAVAYKECLKNHAASLGGHALDGCGEFMPSPNSTHSDPTSLKCAACGCHRNFHRRDPEDSHSPKPINNNPPLPLPPPLATIEYQPHHRHHPPAPIHPRSPNSASPPPISSSYYPSAPHMLLALSGSGPGDNPNPNPNPNLPTASPHHHGSSSSSRKRFRSKFTQHQKDRMHEFAERVGWKLQKRDDDLVLEFCNEVKVDKGVLKVWMHNNKNTFGKSRVTGNSNSAAADGGSVSNNNGDGPNPNHRHHHHHHNHLFENDNVGGGGGANGSSSSS